MTGEFADDAISDGQVGEPANGAVSHQRHNTGQMTQNLLVL